MKTTTLIGYAKTRQELDDITDQAKSDYDRGMIGVAELQAILQTAYAQRAYL